MIERMELRNFQCHDLVRVKFDKRITVFVGSSDSGKSAIIRALRWLISNRPAGDSFIKDGEDQTQVRVWLDGNNTVVRRKGKGKGNLYKFNEREFKAFGNDVPEDVAAALNMDDTNIQQQHDGPYWFSLNAGEVAKELNRIVDLTVIDDVLAAANKELRAASSELVVGRKNLEKLNEEMQQLDYLDDFESDLEDLEVLEKRLVALDEKIAVISEKSEKLSSAIKGLKDSAEIRKRYEKHLHAAGEDLESLKKIHQELVSFEEQIDDLESSRIALEDLISQIDDLDESIEKLTADYEEKKRIANVCPECGRPF